MAAGGAHADTITVCLDGSCDFVDIESAIGASNDGDIIEVGAGTYYPTATLNPAGKAIRIQGATDRDGALLTEIHGRDSGRVAQCTSGEGPQTVLANLRIVHGDAWEAAGLLIDGASPTVEGCTFQFNDAPFGAGAVETRASKSSFRGCRFLSNFTMGGGGGITAVNSELEVLECEFRNNGGDGYGGAIKIQGGAIRLVDSVLISNGCTAGGALALISCTATIDRCVISGNYASTDGGCLYATQSDVRILETQLGSSQAGSGGGIAAFGSVLRAAGSQFIGNLAGGGGAAWLQDCTGQFEDCTLDSNLADVFGGAAYLANSSPTFLRCRVSRNQGYPDSGIRLDESSHPVIASCTFCEHDFAMQGVVNGDWIDGGGNCFSYSCADSDQDGTPDECGTVQDGIHHVPAEFPTVNAAIRAAGHGDVIEIDAGVHYAVDWINPLGKALVLRGAVGRHGYPVTIIDLQEYNIRCVNRESAATVFENLIIRNGFDETGGALLLLRASPTVRNCVLTGNRAGIGGAAYLTGSSSTFEDCFVFDNSAIEDGGALFLHASAASCRSTLVCGNLAPGGSQIAGDSSLTDLGSNCVVQSCIDCDSDGDGVLPPMDNCPALFNPMQLDCDSDGFGDACELASGEAVDLDASGVPDSCECLADMLVDGQVDGADLGILLSQWGPRKGAVADINRDGAVDGADLSILLNSWGACP